MEERGKLIKKVKLLLKRAKIPEWLHHFGPKKFKFFDHLFALLVKKAYQLSFRRTVKLLRGFGFKVPGYSALCKMRRRFPKPLWDALFHETIPQREVRVAAIDSTTLSRTSPSWHYIHRIGRKKPIKCPLKLSMIVETAGKKRILAMRLRVKHTSHDIKDVKYLLKRTKPNLAKLTGDTAYDAEWLHEYCFLKGITTIIKPRKNVKRGFYRKKMQKKYTERLYHRRSMVESVYSSLKRKFGQGTLARKVQTQRAEMYCAAILHNLSLRNLEIFN